MTNFKFRQVTSEKPSTGGSQPALPRRLKTYNGKLKTYTGCWL
jgi:hypothetical protein